MRLLDKIIEMIKRHDTAQCHVSSQCGDMKKFLVTGLGNMGPEYVGTRHNIGFMVADTLVASANGAFSSCRYGDMARVKVKNCELLVLKPSTFMNLSGVAIRYWMNHEKLPLENLLVVVDDLALPFGALRMRGSGSDAGHNGLKNIASELGTQKYARLRVGVGNDFARGSQIDFVLGKFPTEEQAYLPEVCKKASDAVKAYCLSGLAFAMNHFNQGGINASSSKNQSSSESSSSESSQSKK